MTKDTNVDNKATNQWLGLNMSSHIEGYIMAQQEQEINTRDSLKRKELEKETRNEQHLSIKNVEKLYHVTTGCPAVSSSLYLNICHNAIAKIILEMQKKLKENLQILGSVELKAIR